MEIVRLRESPSSYAGIIIETPKLRSLSETWQYCDCMRKNHASKATLILGAGGFLGSTIFRLISQQGSVYKTIRGSVEFVEGSFESKVELDSLRKYGALHVINCSSGRLQNHQDAIASNLAFPSSILKRVTDLSVPVTWTQFDSYTQYSQGEIHDLNYVNTKNLFNDYLDSQFEERAILSLERISLPHLYGVGDNILRFLPKMFCRILLGEDIIVLSPNELIPIIDVYDCAKIVLENSAVNNIDLKYNKKVVTSISPTEIVSAYDLLSAFKVVTNSQGNLAKGEDVPEIFTEKWNISEQPLEIQSLCVRTSRLATFNKIHAELRGKCE